MTRDILGVTHLAPVVNHEALGLETSWARDGVRKYSWLDATFLETVAVQKLRASHPHAQWVVLTAGELAASAKPTEDPSTVLRATLSHFRSSWPTVRFVAMEETHLVCLAPLRNLVPRELGVEPILVEASDVLLHSTFGLRATHTTVLMARPKVLLASLSGCCEDQGLIAPDGGLRDNRQRT